MRYKLLLLDIDGTLRPGSCEQIPKENAAAVRAVQKAGVKIAIATGRGRTGVGKGLLRDLKPDYWVCAGGAQLVETTKGNDLALHRLTAEEMYALVDFFEDSELPLRFTFHDANYAYIDFAEFDRREKAKNLYNNIVDGEDQDHHLVEMPFGSLRLPAPGTSRAVPGKVRLSRPAVSLLLPRQRWLRYYAKRRQ